MNKIFTILIFAFSALSPLHAQEIIHDAEYYVIEAQNGEKWALDGKNIDAKLEEIRNRNGNKPPNIVFMLLDDVGFGELGMPVTTHPM